MNYVSSVVDTFGVISRLILENMTKITAIIKFVIQFIAKLPSFWSWIPEEFKVLICLIISTAVVLKYLGTE